MGNREVRVGVESTPRAEPCLSGPIVGVCESYPMAVATITLLDMAISGPKDLLSLNPDKQGDIVINNLKGVTS